MDYLNDYIASAIPIKILELLAAVSGTYYVTKVSSRKWITYFVAFLWFTLVLEIVGAYAPIGYFSKYEYFSFVKDTKFADNAWLYNIYLILGITFYILFFKSYIKVFVWKKLFSVAAIFYFVSSFLYLLITDVFFTSYSPYSSILGTILLLFCVSRFYFELLKSDLLLSLKHYLPFYISIGVLVFYLCMTPLEIFSQHFSSENNLFVEIRAMVLTIANVFMYGTFILGFLICQNKKYSY